jgi:hypothetical protein
VFDSGRPKPGHSGFAVLAAGAGLLSAGLVYGQAPDCFGDLLGDLNDCDLIGTHLERAETQNRKDGMQCKSEAIESYDSCVRGEPENDAELNALWQEYHDNLESCIENFPNDPVTLEICLTAALRGLQIELCILDGGDPIACTPPAMPGRIGARGAGAAGGGADAGGTPGVWMDLVPAMLANPDQPRDPTLLTTADATVTVGLGADGDARPIDAPRARGSLLLAVYHGPGGVVVEPVAGDGFAGDGLVASVDLSRLNLVNGARVVLVDLWLDASRRPVRGDVHQLQIIGGAGAADWDRDGVVGPDDMTAYLGSHAAGVPRADLNGDGAVDHADVFAYLSVYGTSE